MTMYGKKSSEILRDTSMKTADKESAVITRKELKVWKSREKKEKLRLCCTNRKTKAKTIKNKDIV